MARIANLQNTGFKRATAAAARHIVALVTGDRDAGKTHLAMTAPGPIAFQSLDIGEDGVIQQFQESKDIMLARYLPRNIHALDLSDFDAREEQAKEAREVWTQFVGDYQKALDSPDIRTIVWDTAYEVRVLSELCAFGKITQIQPRDRPPQKYELHKIVRQALACDPPKNFIVTDKLKERWVNGQSTDELEPAGFKDVQYLFPTILRLFHEDGNFSLDIERCRNNAKLAGERRDPPFNTIPWLATEIFPGTTVEDWGGAG
jgi:hypothetical protein